MFHSVWGYVVGVSLFLLTLFIGLAGPSILNALEVPAPSPDWQFLIAFGITLLGWGSALIILVKTYEERNGY